VLFEQGVLERLDIGIGEPEGILSEGPRALTTAAGLNTEQIVEQGTDKVVVQEAWSSPNQEGKNWKVVVKLGTIGLATYEDDIWMPLKALLRSQRDSLFLLLDPRRTY
jgi:hypothetical protein